LVTSEEVAGALAGVLAGALAATSAVLAAGAEATAFAGEAAVLVEAVEDEEAAAEPADALVEEPFEVEASELQPLRAAMNEMHTNPEHALSALTLNTIVTCSYCCVMRGAQATIHEARVHAGNASLPSVTPLSAACRPEALRPRLATGLPLNGE
jgi:hypothetical protein